MKFLSSLIVVSTLFIVVSCNNAPKSDGADTTAPKEVKLSTAGIDYAVDTAASKVIWTGSKLVGSSNSGTINVQSGKVLIDSGKVVGGEFVFDMQSIQPQLADAQSSAKLKQHLSSSDFFATDSFPTAKFEITGVKKGVDTANVVFKQANNMIFGNLTIKGITKGIEFPAKISLNGNNMTAEANFNIDRTKWGINYGSENSMKDRIISKDIEFKLDISSSK
ncbi:YceI family protein [Arachidicoccus sp.]|uniref:YceI family protein n=1 Tax=Arachidicoccus sp. TaxID=1872624 RepID=UPI003D2530EF